MNFPTPTAFVVLALLLGSVSSAVADDTPGVSLILSAASAAQRSDDVLIRCDVTIANDTEKPLVVISNFSSALDGLELVVTDVDGKVLKQQPYTFHQSPFSPSGREFALKRGKTQTSLVFPLSRFSKIGQPLKVRLVGTLPGSTYMRILSTETLQVVVTNSATADEKTTP